MAVFYPEIRLVHIAAISLMGLLFLLRGALALRHGGAAWLRYLSYSVDTVWLTAALMLMTILQQYPFIDAWLTVKLLLVLVFVALRLFAFSPSVPRARRIALWIAGAAVYGFIVSIARTHDPWGFLGGMMG
ncbi:MAG TPA: SirB2 family protein [Ferrovibrio sp.]|jgi:uncharacterized membrane protein SirB2|uniref:SirB2 family protein n=1 Tax=Ferrovibrio sp. TaxID=1917215 RepID=UPI002ED6AFC2